MKKFLHIFFLSFGIIFFVLILLGIFIYVADPFDLRSPSAGDGVDKNPILNESQEKSLETFGIDPASIPSEFTPAQQTCFESRLGKDRVAEIKAGATPTMAEYLENKDCI